MDGLSELHRRRHAGLDRPSAIPCWKSNPNGDRAAELGEQSPWRRLGRTPPHSRGSHWRAAFDCGSDDHASRPTSTPLAALQSSQVRAALTAGSSPRKALRPRQHRFCPVDIRLDQLRRDQFELMVKWLQQPRPSDGTRRKPRSQSPSEHRVRSNRPRFPPSLSNLLKRRETPWRLGSMAWRCTPPTVRFDQGREAERFEVGIGEPNGEGRQTIRTTATPYASPPPDEPSGATVGVISLNGRSQRTPSPTTCGARSPLCHPFFITHGAG